VIDIILGDSPVELSCGDKELDRILAQSNPPEDTRKHLLDFFGTRHASLQPIAAAWGRVLKQAGRIEGPLELGTINAVEFAQKPRMIPAKHCWKEGEAPAEDRAISDALNNTSPESDVYIRGEPCQPAENADTWAPFKQLTIPNYDRTSYIMNLKTNFPGLRIPEVLKVEKPYKDDPVQTLNNVTPAGTLVALHIGRSFPPKSSYP
jgi:hypothetical protein